MPPKLFTIKKIDTDEDKVAIEPTDYLQNLGSLQAIEAVKDHCDALVQELKKATGADPEKRENAYKSSELLYELEVGQKYLTYLREDYASRSARHRSK